MMSANILLICSDPCFPQVLELGFLKSCNWEKTARGLGCRAKCFHLDWEWFLQYFLPISVVLEKILPYTDNLPYSKF